VVGDPADDRPWNDIDPSTARITLSGRRASKLRWVNRRWKPMVTPWAITK
jgi:hypothetical protein